MKRTIIFIFLLFLIFFIFSRKNDDWPVLKGPYLGQKPPGMQREIFAPGIVSTGYNEHSVSFTPDGKEIYFRLLGAPHGVVLTTREGPGGWSPLKVASFSGKYDSKCCLSPDGKTILLSSGSPPSGEGPVLPYWTIWIIKRTDTGWGKPVNLAHLRGAYPTMSNKGTIYFYARAENNKGDIYKSVLENGKYSEARRVGPPISTQHWENDPYIAPDESFLIFQTDRPGEFGMGDLFISYRLKDGRWSEPRNMGTGVNTKKSGQACPWVTSDGKFMFFSGMSRDFKRYSETPLDYKKKINFLTSSGFGSEDVFWVSGKIIEDLKPDELK